MEKELTEQEQAIYTNIIVPAFLQKCAERGRKFDPAEIELHLENAAMVQQAKQAESASMAKTANTLLKSALGFQDAATQSNADQRVKLAASKIVDDPEMVNLLSTGAMAKEAFEPLVGAGLGAGVGGAVGGLPGAAVGGLAGLVLPGVGRFIGNQMGMGGNVLSAKDQMMNDRIQKTIADNAELSRNAQLARGAYKAAPNPYGEGQ